VIALRENHHGYHHFADHYFAHLACVWRWLLRSGSLVVITGLTLEAVRRLMQQDAGVGDPTFAHQVADDAAASQACTNKRCAIGPA
jgi:hypothetical protein